MALKLLSKTIWLELPNSLVVELAHLFGDLVYSEGKSTFPSKSGFSLKSVLFGYMEPVYHPQNSFVWENVKNDDFCIQKQKMTCHASVGQMRYKEF
jgi:hypothetical protein